MVHRGDAKFCRARAVADRALRKHHAGFAVQPGLQSREHGGIRLDEKNLPEAHRLVALVLLPFVCSDVDDPARLQTVLAGERGQVEHPWLAFKQRRPEARMSRQKIGVGIVLHRWTEAGAMLHARRRDPEHQVTQALQEFEHFAQRDSGIPIGAPVLELEEVDVTTTQQLLRAPQHRQFSALDIDLEETDARHAGASAIIIQRHHPHLQALRRLHAGFPLHRPASMQAAPRRRSRVMMKCPRLVTFARRARLDEQLPPVNACRKSFAKSLRMNWQRLEEMNASRGAMREHRIRPVTGMSADIEHHRPGLDESPQDGFFPVRFGVRGWSGDSRRHSAPRTGSVLPDFCLHQCLFDGADERLARRQQTRFVQLHESLAHLAQFPERSSQVAAHPPVIAIQFERAAEALPRLRQLAGLIQRQPGPQMVMAAQPVLLSGGISRRQRHNGFKFRAGGASDHLLGLKQLFDRRRGKIRG